MQLRIEMRRATARVMLVSFALACAPSWIHAQVRVGRDSSTRLNRFGRDMVYGTGMGLVYGEIDQLRNDPPQWGSGWDGYGHRAMSDVGEFAIQEGTTEALAAVWHRPLDYQRCQCHDYNDRFRWALWNSFTDPMPHDRHPIAWHRIIGAYVGSFAQASWRPATSNRTGVAIGNGTLSLAIGAGINLFHEFVR
jgi:hypothetical protein